MATGRLVRRIGLKIDKPISRHEAAGCSLLLVSAVFAAGPGWAQQPATSGDSSANVGRSWRIVPRISVTETFTDNVGYSPNAKQSEQITEISPGVRIQSNAARLNGYLDYTLRNFVYAKGTAGNSLQNALNAFGTFTAIDRWAFVDFNGNISQQSISAFGPQASSSGNLNANSTETSTYRISPYVRGRLASFADYTVRYSHSETRASSALATSSVVDQFIATLSGTTPISVLSWSIDANRQSSSFGSGRTSENDQFQGRLKLRVNPQFSINGSIGTESNDYATPTKQSRNTFGYGAEWAPTERTQLTVSRERRFFGNGHSIAFSHRMPLTTFRFTDSKNVTTSSTSQVSGPQGTYYDLLYGQLASSVPDPAQRALQTTALLQQAGIAPNSPVTNGFLTARVSIQRRQELSMVVNGLRNTVTYTLFQSTNDSFGAASVGVDDFSTSQSIKQRGMSSNFSHRLSPLTSLNAFTSWSRSDGSGGGGVGLNTTQRTFNLNMNTRLSQRVGLSLGFRATRAESTTAPYRENAFLGTLSAQY